QFRRRVCRACPMSLAFRSACASRFRQMRPRSSVTANCRCAMEKIPLTRAGHAALNSELKTLKSKERPQVIAAIAEARAHGDLSENAEYHAAREKQGFIEARVRELESILARADVIDTASLSGPVKFGAIVRLIDEDT